MIAYEPRFLPFFFSVPSLGVLLSLAALRLGLAVRSVLVHRKEKIFLSSLYNGEMTQLVVSSLVTC